MEDFGQIGIRVVGYRREVIHKGCIEERELVSHVANIRGHRLERIFPELANEKPTRSDVGVKVLDEAFQEFFRKMLDGVEADSLDGDLTAKPNAPSLNVCFDFWVSIIEVGEPLSESTPDF